MENRRALCWLRRHAERIPPDWRERADARDCGAARSPECAVSDDCASILGLDVGWGRFTSRDPDHGDDEGGLRSRAHMAPGRPLARRVMRSRACIALPILRAASAN